MTGVYLRVKRHEKMFNVEVEHLTDNERKEAFCGKSREEIMRWFHVVCNTAAEFDKEARNDC